LFASHEEVVGRGSRRNYFYHSEGFFLSFPGTKKIYKIPNDQFESVCSELVYKDDHNTERLTIAMYNNWSVVSYPSYRFIKIIDGRGVVHKTIYVSEDN
jgi:hypothetical protein